MNKKIILKVIKKYNGIIKDFKKDYIEAIFFNEKKGHYCYWELFDRGHGCQNMSYINSILKIHSDDNGHF